MSNMIPSMLSTSPPPLDNALDDDDEDDDYGDFAAGSMDYDLIEPVQPSTNTSLCQMSPWSMVDLKQPSASPVGRLEEGETPTQNGMCGGRDSDPGTTDEEEEEGRHQVSEVPAGPAVSAPPVPGKGVEEELTLQQDNTSQDSVVSGATDSGLCSASQNSDGTSPLPPGDFADRLSPVDVPCDESSESDETLVRSVEERKRTLAGYGREVAAPPVASQDPPAGMPWDTGMEGAGCAADHPCHFGDFSRFEAAAGSVLNALEGEKEEGYGAFESADREEAFADFGEAPADAGRWADAGHPVLNPADDDFEDFETADFTGDAGACRVDHVELLSRLQRVVSTLFPSPPPQVLPEPFAWCLEDGASGPVWDSLKDIEASHALSFQWSGSAANKALLAALGIDLRNILFGPRWNASVPRFAANLGLSPLEPVRAPQAGMQVVDADAAAAAQATTEESVPAAQFDWNSSGLVNPLDCSHLALLDLEYLNTFDNLTSSSSRAPDAAWEHTSAEADPEAAQVLASLPDLWFVRAKTLVWPAPASTSSC